MAPGDRSTRGATPAHRYPGGPDRYRGRVQGRPADPLAHRFCPAGRDLRRARCVVRFGDAAIQHHELDGAPDPQCAVAFAQFEREVTGERIRDKIAASKKKGMWMGGNVPLGIGFV